MIECSKNIKYFWVIFGINSIQLADANRAFQRTENKLTEMAFKTGIITVMFTDSAHSQHNIITQFEILNDVLYLALVCQLQCVAYNGLHILLMAKTASGEAS